MEVNCFEKDAFGHDIVNLTVSEQSNDFFLGE
jgi:hypothetical protein